MQIVYLFERYSRCSVYFALHYFSLCLIVTYSQEDVKYNQVEENSGFDHRHVVSTETVILKRICHFSDQVNEGIIRSLF